MLRWAIIVSLLIVVANLLLVGPPSQSLRESPQKVPQFNAKQKPNSGLKNEAETISKRVPPDQRQPARHLRQPLLTHQKVNERRAMARKREPSSGPRFLGSG